MFCPILSNIVVKIICYLFLRYWQWVDLFTRGPSSFALLYMVVFKDRATYIKQTLNIIQKIISGFTHTLPKNQNRQNASASPKFNSTLWISTQKPYTYAKYQTKEAKQKYAQYNEIKIYTTCQCCNGNYRSHRVNLKAGYLSPAACRLPPAADPPAALNGRRVQQKICVIESETWFMHRFGFRR